MPADIRLSGAQTNWRSESDIRINHANPSQFVAASNAVNDGPLAVFYSGDGGGSWNQTLLPAVTGDNFQGDPAVDWTSDGTAWALCCGISGSVVVRSFKSTNGGQTWTYDSLVSDTQNNVDKPMLWVDHSPTSPYQDTMYALWWNNSPTYVSRRAGPGGAWSLPQQISGAETTNGSDGGDIKTNTFGDVFAFWPSEAQRTLNVRKSTDGGVTFSARVKIADTFGAFLFGLPAQDSRRVLLYISGGAYRTATEDMVYAVWMDLAGGAGCNSSANFPNNNVMSACKTRIYFSRSNDGGGTWSAPVKLNDQNSLNDQFFPRLTVDDVTGRLMVVYYDTVGDAGRLKTDIWMQTSTDNGGTWSGAERITSGESDETAGGFNGNQYGDYIGLTGYAGNYFACWTDRRGGGVEEIWGSRINPPSCSFIVDKSTFGKDEVAVGLPNASYSPAYWLAVDGFSQGDLGFANPAALNNPNPNPAPVVTATLNAALNPSLTGAQLAAINGALPTVTVNQLLPLPIVAQDPTLALARQRFLYPYTISFADGSAFAPLQVDQAAVITLNASITANQTTCAAAADIELVAGENPYYTNVDTSNPNQPFWLSFDLRFFKVTGGNSRFGAPNMSNDPADAPTFITNVLTNLNTPGANLMGDSFGALQQDEGTSALEFLRQDAGGHFTFNFALARVRLVGNTPGAQAKKVRVFFRLFQAQTTGSDFHDQTTYRFGTDNVLFGNKIALLGVQNDVHGNPEYVTIPCFAEVRKNLTAPVDMHAQTDAPNARDITVVAGVEVDTYFGCWLDINQPQQQFLPQTPPAGNWDGPWTTLFNNNQLKSVNEAITRAPHQCLIAEIRFDDTPIPPGATSATSDKLAQRNIAWIDGPNPGAADSRRMPHPFEIRPSPATVLTADELMIMWGNTPRGSTASFYLPAVNAAEIIALADAMYGTHLLTAEDANTIRCPAGGGGATFIPIPKGTGRHAGLLTVELPAGIRRGEVFDITVRQLTEGMARFKQSGPPLTFASSRSPGVGQFAWRRILGAFDITITISTKQQLLYREERLLAWLRWIQQAIPAQNRWYPVFGRYVEQIGGRVHGFGGDPGTIFPSPTGNVPHAKGRGDERVAFRGKVEALKYDRFGDFAGFVLELFDEGDRSFRSREAAVEALVREAWEDEVVVTVVVERDAPHVPVSIILGRSAAHEHRPD